MQRHILGFLGIAVELANLPNISANLKKKCRCQMVTHVTIHPYCPHCCLILVLHIIEAFNLRTLWCEKQVYCSSILEMADICTIQPWSKRQGSENEWPDYWRWAIKTIILRWMTIWHPQFIVTLAEILGKFASSIGISKNLEWTLIVYKSFKTALDTVETTLSDKNTWWLLTELSDRLSFRYSRDHFIGQKYVVIFDRIKWSFGVILT